MIAALAIALSMSTVSVKVVAPFLPTKVTVQTTTDRQLFDSINDISKHLEKWAKKHDLQLVTGEEPAKVTIEVLERGWKETGEKRSDSRRGIEGGVQTHEKPVKREYVKAKVTAGDLTAEWEQVSDDPWCNFKCVGERLAGRVIGLINDNRDKLAK